MKFKLWREYGALNSKPVFDAFAAGVISSGHQITDDNPDINVIWSVLFHGRMAPNKLIWDQSKASNIPVIVLEVGGIKRGTTWKVGLNGINRDGYFGNTSNTSNRVQSLGLKLVPWRQDGEFILICGQHDRSLQWQNQPRMSNWFLQTYDTIRQYTDRPIIFRPHPRCPLPEIEQGLKHVYRQKPKQIIDTYDDYDMSFNNIWCTINWSSNPGIHSIINGVPAIVGQSSLAWEVAEHHLENIENPRMPAREDWLNQYAWTEYTIDEICNALPLINLTDRLNYVTNSV